MPRKIVIIGPEGTQEFDLDAFLKNAEDRKSNEGRFIPGHFPSGQKAEKTFKEALLNVKIGDVIGGDWNINFLILSNFEAFVEALREKGFRIVVSKEQLEKIKMFIKMREKGGLYNPQFTKDEVDAFLKDLMFEVAPLGQPIPGREDNLTEEELADLNNPVPTALRNKITDLAQKRNDLINEIKKWPEAEVNPTNITKFAQTKYPNDTISYHDPLQSNIQDHQSSFNRTPDFNGPKDENGKPLFGKIRYALNSLKYQNPDFENQFKKPLDPTTVEGKQRLEAYEKLYAAYNTVIYQANYQAIKQRDANLENILKSLTAKLQTEAVEFTSLENLALLKAIEAFEKANAKDKKKLEELKILKGKLEKVKDATRACEKAKTNTDAVKLTLTQDEKTQLSSLLNTRKPAAEAKLDNDEIFSYVKNALKNDLSIDFLTKDNLRDFFQTILKSKEFLLINAELKQSFFNKEGKQSETDTLNEIDAFIENNLLNDDRIREIRRQERFEKMGNAMLQKLDYIDPIPKKGEQCIAIYTVGFKPEVDENGLVISEEKAFDMQIRDEKKELEDYAEAHPGDFIEVAQLVEDGQPEKVKAIEAVVNAINERALAYRAQMVDKKEEFEEKQAPGPGQIGKLEPVSRQFSGSRNILFSTQSTPMKIVPAKELATNQNTTSMGPRPGRTSPE